MLRSSVDHTMVTACKGEHESELVLCIKPFQAEFLGKGLLSFVCEHGDEPSDPIKGRIFFRQRMDS